ncbi:MAG: hypothetical protein APF83_13565 [Lutibacter sp. BRH_c52]|nr:MAG: hypothetical protein APF83_13565 [Lutibacter sp. BRH_c52]
MNRKNVKVFVLCFSFMLIAVAAYSEPTPPKPELSNAPPPPPPGLPIDGGLSVLFASGVAYGIYSLKRKK